MKNIIYFYSLLFLIITGCNSQTTTATDPVTPIYDPKIPGTNISANSAIKGVYNLTICPDANSTTCPTSTAGDYNKVTLKWQIPSLYKSEQWTAVIFKSKVSGSNVIDTITNPPTELGSISFEKARGQILEYVDTDIIQSTNYYYWVFLVINGSSDTAGDTKGYWSTSSRYLVSTISQKDSATLPSGDAFWKTVKFNNLVSEPNNNTYDRSRLKTGQQTVGNPKGHVAIANNGSAAFVTDTDNNRILVFENSQMKECQQFINDDLQYYACSLQGSSQAPAAINILGQPDEKVTYSCQQHDQICATFTTESDCLLQRNSIPSFCNWSATSNSCSVKADQCLTKPTELLVNNNNLFVSDSGNDRVLEYKSIYYTPTGLSSTELIGCDANILISTLKPIKCNADKVFGKSNLFDLISHPVAFYGSSSLSNPTGLAINGNDLYIADTNNNRVVKASNYNDDNKYLCNNDTWLSSLCQWSGLLGQPNYNTNRSFKTMYQQDQSIMGGTFYNQLLENINAITLSDGSKLFEGTSNTILKKYFANPTKIQFVTSGSSTYLFIAANEDFETLTGIGTKIALKGRILRFNNNPIELPSSGCNSATFGLTGCDADEIIGQEDFNKFIILNGISGGSGVYTNTSYGIEAIDDLAFLGNSLLVLDGKNNFVYEWANILNKDLPGFPYNSKVLNPNGAYLGNNQSLPNLVSISGIAYDELNAKLLIVDGNGSKIYFMDFQNSFIP